MLNGTHFYNKTIRKSVAVFGTIFNNIKILRTGATEEKVPISYGPRKKFLARINSDSTGSKSETIAIKLPRMSFEITSIEYDSTAKLNKFNQRALPIDGDNSRVDLLYQSVPYTLGMQLNIYAENQNEALQIVEQIIPTFSPEYTIAIKELEGADTTTDVPIVLNGVTFQDDYEGDFLTRRSIIYTLDFGMKIKFAGATTKSAIIRKVDTFFFADKDDRDTLKLNEPYGTENENVRVAVDDADAAPLDDSDTITTTFGFDHG
jgi:hypothetical protein